MGLFFFVAAAAIAYLAALRTFDLAATASEHTFHAGPESGDRLKIYLEPLWVDAVNDAIEIRLSVAPNRSLRGHRPDAPISDVTVNITTGDTTEVRVFRADQPIPQTRPQRWQHRPLSA